MQLVTGHKVGRFSARLVGLFVVVALALPVPAWAHEQRTGGGRASFLGQADGEGTACNQGREQPNSSTLCSPSDVSVDPVSGRVFVADRGNYRVTSWANRHQADSGEPADLVLGQPDFETAEPCLAVTEVCFEPFGLTVDRDGALYVLDSASNRLLRFNPPLRNGQPADLVLDPAESCNSACNPQAAAKDFRGDLFFAETANNRILLQVQSATGTQPSGGGQGTTIVVTTTRDEVAVNGRCSLREAILAANTNTVVDSCPAGGSEDTIVVPAGTYRLMIGGDFSEDEGRATDLDITSSLKLEGAGAGVTIIDGRGLGLERVLQVFGAATVVTISGLTVSGGLTENIGGGLAISGGTVTIRDSTFRDNQAGNQGAAIANLGGTLTLINSTLSHNGARFGGGGVLNGGQMTIINSTISNNVSNGPGGGILHVGLGSSSVSGSTISGNFATSGGGILSSSTLAVDSTTIVGNTGGGLQGDATLGQSIIANNPGFEQVPGGPVPDCAGTILSLGFNLIRDQSGCTLTGNTTGNQTGVDPLLGPLQDNGGPTLTHALLIGSPAIDAVLSGTCPSTDQRGVSRPQDGNGDGKAKCDIGAFERTP